MNMIITRGEWHSGVHFIFASIKRAPDGKEFDELCSKYFQEHQNITKPGEALWVDLRPAFEMPLSAVRRSTFLSVPIDYTPPT